MSLNNWKQRKMYQANRKVTTQNKATNLYFQILYNLCCTKLNVFSSMLDFDLKYVVIITGDYKRRFQSHEVCLVINWKDHNCHVIQNLLSLSNSRCTGNLTKIGFFIGRGSTVADIEIIINVKWFVFFIVIALTLWTIGIIHLTAL